VSDPTIIEVYDAKVDLEHKMKELLAEFQAQYGVGVWEVIFTQERFDATPLFMESRGEKEYVVGRMNLKLVVKI
jgi:hypothetical protein